MAAAFAGSATVILPSGKTTEVPLTNASPGLFTGTLEGDEIGLYRIEQGDSPPPPTPRDLPASLKPRPTSAET